MRELRAVDPADLVVAWEAVEELLAAVPEGDVKDVLRMVAAGVPAAEIAERLQLAAADVEALVARGRIRVLTAAVARDRDRADRRTGGGSSTIRHVPPSPDRVRAVRRGSPTGGTDGG